MWQGLPHREAFVTPTTSRRSLRPTLTRAGSGLVPDPVFLSMNRVSVMGSFAIFFLTVIAFASGGSALMQYTASREPWWLATAAVCFVIGNGLYIHILETHGLGVGTLLTSMAQMVILTLVGWLFFSEAMTLAKVIGLGFALAAMAMALLSSANS